MTISKKNSEIKQEEFLDLYEECRESLVRFSRSMTHNIEDAKDLVQDTILSAYDQFENLKNKRAFKSFLFTIASRIHKRKIWRKRFFANFMDNESKEYVFDNLVSKETSPENAADIQALNLALNSLAEKYKEAIVLYEIIGLSMEEISEIQNVSISGVKSRVQRARKQLEEILIKERKYSFDEMERRSLKIKTNIDASINQRLLLDLHYYKTEVLP